MVNVTASKEPKEGIDFFPLSVDFEEKLYSVGKIPGSYTKREGKPSDKAILTSRAIDRPLRPLFPKDFRNDVCSCCNSIMCRTRQFTRSSSNDWCISSTYQYQIYHLEDQQQQ